jgi:dTDP-4-amino-4,6-dideoxygalactose transaminase
MSEVFAAIGRKQLMHLDSWLTKRRSIATKFSEILESNTLLQAPSIRSNSKHAWHQFCIQATSAKEFIEHMNNHGIDSRLVYPAPCHHHPVYAGHPQSEEVFSTTQRLCRELVAIPVHHGLTEGEIERILEAIRSYS